MSIVVFMMWAPVSKDIARNILFPAEGKRTRSRSADRAWSFQTTVAPSGGRRRSPVPFRPTSRSRVLSFKPVPDPQLRYLGGRDKIWSHCSRRRVRIHSGRPGDAQEQRTMVRWRSTGAATSRTAGGSPRLSKHGDREYDPAEQQPRDQQRPQNVHRLRQQERDCRAALIQRD